MPLIAVSCFGGNEDVHREKSPLLNAYARSGMFFKRFFHRVRL